jgi:hypothetical protein
VCLRSDDLDRTAIRVALYYFGTLLGWIGVALTGSDTASNVLFGSLQRISSEQLSERPSRKVFTCGRPQRNTSTLRMTQGSRDHR